MSNKTFFILLAGVILLIISFFKYRKRALYAEQKLKATEKQLANVESERKQLSDLLPRNWLG